MTIGVCVCVWGVSTYFSIFWEQLVLQHVQIVVRPFPGVTRKIGKSPHGTVQSVIDLYHSEKKKKKKKKNLLKLYREAKNIKMFTIFPVRERENANLINCFSLTKAILPWKLILTACQPTQGYFMPRD